MDKKFVVERLKANGLELGEDLAIVAMKAVFKTIPELFLESENKYDDMLIPVFKVIEPNVMAKLDKLDGKVG